MRGDIVVRYLISDEDKFDLIIVKPAPKTALSTVTFAILVHAAGTSYPARGITKSVRFFHHSPSFVHPPPHLGMPVWIWIWIWMGIVLFSGKSGGIAGVETGVKESTSRKVGSFHINCVH